MKLKVVAVAFILLGALTGCGAGSGDDDLVHAMWCDQHGLSLTDCAASR